MQHTTATPRDVKQWLLDRGITEKVLNESGVAFQHTINIPIFDKNGSVLFFKRRKNPFDTSDAPKYKYDQGATSSLYNIQKPLVSPVIICEGELDALLCNSFGFSAVSSTGGAGTFKQEWADLLEEYDVLICLDNDESGIRGAIKIQQMLPKAKWVHLPVEYGKDVTEYVHSQGSDALIEILKTGTSFYIPKELVGIPETKKAIEAKQKEFGVAAERIKELQRFDGSGYLDMIRRFCIDRMGHYRKVAKSFGNKLPAGTLSEIKRIPITNYLQFNPQGFARCLWHSEVEPSLKYNGERSAQPNTVHCFGACGKSFDIIDVVMQLEGISFVDAIKKLKT